MAGHMSGFRRARPARPPRDGKGRTSPSAAKSQNEEASRGGHLRFEKLISGLSARFVNVPADQVDNEIEAALKQVLDFFQVDRCGLLQTSSDRKSWQVAFVAYADGITPVPEKTELPMSLFPWVANRLLERREVVFFGTLDDLPPEASTDKQTYRAWGIKSCINIPIFIGGPVDYVLAINAVSRECAWTEDYIPRLRLLGEIFVNALFQRQLQERLQTATREWQKTFNTIQDMIMIMDREFRIVQVNDAAVKFFGVPKEKIIGAECFKLMHRTESPIDGCPYKKMMDSRGREETEVYDAQRAMWFHIVVDPLLDETEHVMGVVHMVKDITERKQAEIALSESMERYRAMVETFDGFLYICSPDYRVEFMNRRLIERTGRNAVGEMCYSVLHDRDSICPWCVNEQVFRGKTVRWEVQSPKDHRWYYVVNTPILHTDGTISKQSMIMDITERKRAEETLKESEQALRNNQKDLQRLAGRLIAAQEEELRRLSRELHDDLTQRLAVLAIEAGKLEMELKKVHKSSAVSANIKQIKDQLIKVSEDVHHISRQLHPAILDDLGLVRAIESECATLLRRENIQINFVKNGEFAAVPKDIALCLYRIIQEGLKNIAKHSQARSAEIVLSADDDGISLTVRDGGVGFDPLEVRNKPGLGLSSMRERVHLVQGDFSIRSEPGRGTVIHVRIPLKEGGA